MKLFNGYTDLFIPDYGITRIYLKKFFPDDKTDAILRALKINYLKLDKKYNIRVSRQSYLRKR